MKRSVVRVSMMLALVAGLSGVAASPAGAAPVQSCKSVKGTITMSPGLSLASTANQKVTIKGSESGCTPASKTGGSGAYNSVLTLKKANCTTLAKGGITFQGTATTKWKNGKTTTYSVTYKDGKGNLNAIETITMTGKATKGLFVGKKFAGQWKINVAGANSNACTSKPFKSAPWKSTKAWTLS